MKTWPGAVRMSFALRVLGALTIAALLVLPPARAADEAPARLFAAHALALRSAVVAGEERAAEVPAAMPGAGMAACGTGKLRP